MTTYVVRFPQAEGILQYLGGGGQLEPDPTFARRFPSRDAAERFAAGRTEDPPRMGSAAWWLQPGPGSAVGAPVAEELPTLRQPIPGSEHGPVLRIGAGG